MARREWTARSEDPPDVNARVRLSILLLGPIPIIGMSWGLTHLVRSQPPEMPEDNRAIVRVARWAGAGGADEPQGRVAEASLERRCREQADRVRSRLGAECRLIARPPMVIGGDLAEQELDAWHRHTIGPAARAMSHAYFRTPPSEPITILLFAGENSYNQYTRQLFGEEGISVYGFYKPQERMLVMNIATGGGTLVHELTHALVDFDFPQIPAWFNEGLASLHEACHILPDERGIEGLTNWRLPGLQRSIAERGPPSLSKIIAAPDFRAADVGLNYAVVRYFCLYLQHRGLLEDFYREFRAHQATDPTGARTLERLFAPSEWSAVERDFVAWVQGLNWQRDGS